MVSLRRVVAATTSAVIRLMTFIFLRWVSASTTSYVALGLIYVLQIPGHPFAPIITTSLGLYLASIGSLVKDQQRTNDRAAQNQKTSSSEYKDQNRLFLAAC